MEEQNFDIRNQHKEIENQIFNFRGVHVMIDRDLANLYDVETRIINQAVKRNTNRFPSDFCFQLSEEEFNNWKSQIVISESDKIGLRKRPYAFTEQGVSMLASVLRSDTAVQISVQIIRAFVLMRTYLQQNTPVIERIQNLETKQIETEIKINKVLSALENKEIQTEKGIFYDGQIFDAYSFFSNIIRQAKKSIILIDNYIDESILTLFSKKESSVKLTIYTKNISRDLKLDLDKFNLQYCNAEIKELNQSHDRFLIIDDTDLYHIGASLKDLGKKWFAFSKMNSETISILNKLSEN